MPEHHGCVVVGAGPAGLAAAAVLKTHGVAHVVIERADRVGDRWHRHYERLHLHTTRRISGLPYRGFPDTAPRYPSRQQVCDYLEDYARHFDLRPRFGVELARAARRDGVWQLDTSEGAWTTDRLVIATGYNRVPVLPELPGIEDFAGPTVHSGDYRSGAAYAGQRVLVVGCGNSGAEIALDLWERGARPTMVVRGPIHVTPRDLPGSPTSEVSLLLAQLPVPLADALSGITETLVIGDLSRWGIARPAAGIYTMIRDEGRIPLLDVGTIAAVKRGDIAVAPAVEGFTRDGARFADGTERPFDAVVFATGYRAGVLDLIDGLAPVLDRRGLPREHGVEVLPGLHFVGFANPPSGALRGIRLDALAMGEQIAAAQGGQ